MTGSNPPLVSIVTPSLDQARFIYASIRSVASQTYPRIEHIVVDGGSTDGTLDILRHSEAMHGVTWDSRTDAGMYDALNRGFAKAKGDIFAYLNADDFYFPWAVEVAVAALERGPDLVYGDALILDEATGKLRPHFQLAFSLEYLLTVGSFAQPATFWRRELHERVGGFDARYRSAGDLDFFIRASSAGSVAHIDEMLAVMRRHPAMQTIAQANRIRSENAAVRAAHGQRGAGATMRQRVRAYLQRRRAWLRFLLATVRGDSPTGWPRFRALRPSVNWPRAIVGQVPRLGPGLLEGSIDFTDRSFRLLRDPPPCLGSGAHDHSGTPPRP